MIVYILLFSKNERDGILDSSILKCFGNREKAHHELDKIRKEREGDGYTYYLEDYFVEPAMIMEGT